MKLVALILGSVLGAATIPYLPQRVTREEPDEWLRASFDFNQSLSWHLRAYQAPREPRQVRFE